MEDPALAKGLVERSVIRVITPGTIIEEKLLDAGKNNYLLSVYAARNGYGYAYADVSTGEFSVYEIDKAAVRLQDELARIKKLKPLAVRFNELIDSQEMPIRVTHNDTKINNVLFDIETGEAKTVIDLDTVMPGLVAHDFGDAIRFAANTAAEDEPDLSKVSLDINRFRAFAEGFVPELKQSLAPIEIKTMALGAFVMTVEVAVRFLDDYITGDQYFKTNYRGHNLVRARCQLKLAEEMYDRMGEMNKVISDVAGMVF
jgi:hypothetical protein